MNDAAKNLALLTLLKAARASLSAVLLQLEAAIMAVEGGAAKKTAEVPREWPPREECGHTFRERNPVMGDPGRAQCQNPNCGELIPGEMVG